MLEYGKLVGLWFRGNKGVFAHFIMELHTILRYVALICLILSQHMKIIVSQRLSSSHGGSSPTCEPIKIEMCRNIGYSMTGMPNFADNTLQADAKQQLETYGPMLSFNCANELQFFLCLWPYFAKVLKLVSQVLQWQGLLKIEIWSSSRN